MFTDESASGYLFVKRSNDAVNDDKLVSEKWLPQSVSSLPRDDIVVDVVFVFWKRDGSRVSVSPRFDVSVHCDTDDVDDGVDRME